MQTEQQRAVTRLCIQCGLFLLQHGAESALVDELSSRLGRALGMDSAALKDFMANQVGAALNAGDTFGPGGEQFMRINVATQRENLEQFVSRLRLALERLV